ncbi:kinetochore CENP-C fungal-like protein [Dactylonectria macrodidyma]|uniref:CENP-C homolog n=1 Tax=Dactylonectria macrodidyma TaxID=307937 RepID=A0A9P9JFH1_9HYPO|nr:kinetochore CENP-C fungal-like protein [Dactylonectria macrodidyma]
MAPRAKRGDDGEPQAFHELGVRGRKTGVFLPNTGNLDEHGMQPIEDLLSSPEKSPVATNHTPSSDDESDLGSDDMEISDSAGPGPRTVLKDRQLRIPRSRSPIKTNLRSPARKNPHLDRQSSPMRAEEPEATVTRMLDFGANNGRPRTKTNGVNGTLHEEDEDDDEDQDMDDNTNNTVIHHPDDDDDDGLDPADLLDESLQLVNDMAGGTPTPEPESPPIEKAPVARQNQTKKGRGRPKVAPRPIADDTPEEPSVVEEEPVRQNQTKKGRGRPKVAPKAIVEDNPEEPSVIEQNSNSRQSATKKGRGRPSKLAPKPIANEPLEEPSPVAEESRPRKGRGRPARKDNAKEPTSDLGSRKRPASPDSMGSEAQDVEDRDEEPQEAPPPKKQRTVEPKRPQPQSKPQAKPQTKPRGRSGRKPNLPNIEEAGDVGETSFAALQRGPPLPQSRGLVSVRREADTMRQTRSGRHSYKPLDWWRGEQVVHEEEEIDNIFTKDRFVMPTIKEIIRMPEELPPSKRAPRSKARSKAKAKQRPVHVEEEELEDWEISPGTVTGEVILWEPEHELQPPADDEPVEVTDERVAVSADAIQTRDIRDASFRFAKTLTTPFMGAGVVDLPPGAEKRPKNSRKMHMVFFVHYGKVLVTVNDSQFRITAGGMWFVPRGNYYSITNDYDNPSRIFFSQGCEVSSQSFDPDQSQNSTMALV